MRHIRGLGVLSLSGLKSSRGETFLTLHQSTASLTWVTIPEAAAQQQPWTAECVPSTAVCTTGTWETENNLFANLHNSFGLGAEEGLGCTDHHQQTDLPWC